MVKSEGEKMSESEIREVMRQIIEGVEYMHSNGFMHRDLTMMNMQVERERVEGGRIELKVKIGGLNSSKEVKRKEAMSDYTTSRQVRSPEQLLKVVLYDSKVDVFSLGCTYLDLLNHTPLFHAHNDVDQLHQLIQLLGTPSQPEWPDFPLLLSNLNLQLHQQPSQLHLTFPNLS